MSKADKQAIAVKVWREMQQVFIRHLSAMEKHGVDADAMIEAAQSMLLARAKTPGAAPPPPWSPLWMAMTLFTANPCTRPGSELG